MNTSLSNASWKSRAIAGGLAGLVGGLAHAVMNEVDRRLLQHDADDLTMLGGVISDDRDTARTIGIGMHLNFAAAFGAAYAVLLRPEDDAGAMRKAIGAAMVENFGLYPLVFPLERYHPYIRDGRIDRFQHPLALLEATLRHLALGAGIGTTYPRFLRALADRGTGRAGDRMGW